MPVGMFEAALGPQSDAPLNVKSLPDRPTSMFTGPAMQGEDNPNLPIAVRADLTVQRHVQANDWEGAKKDLEQRYGATVGQQAKNDFDLRRQHYEYAKKAPSVAEYAVLRSIPFASSIGTFGMAREYKAARDRYAAGTPEGDDAKTIARYERLQDLDAKQYSTTGGAIRASLAHLPAVIGEAYLTGGVANEIKAARGAGKVAQAAEAAKGAEGVGELGVLGLRNIATRQGARTVAGQGLKFGAEKAVSTAAMPSLYLPQSAESAIQRGGDWSDVDNLGRAYAIGYMQNAILGTLGPVGDKVPTGGPGSFALRLGTRTGTGILEQQAADAVASLSGLQQHKGTLYDLLDGEPGSKKNFASEIVTFAAFSLMHGAPRAKGLKPEPAITPEKLDRKLTPFEDFRKSMGGEVDEKLQTKHNDILAKITEALAKDPTLTRGEAKKLFENEPSEPVKKYAAFLAETLLAEKKVPIEPPEEPAKAPVEPVKPSSEWTDPNAVVEPSDRAQAFDKLSPAVQKELAQTHGVRVEAFRNGKDPAYDRTLKKHLEEVARARPVEPTGADPRLKPIADAAEANGLLYDPEVGRRQFPDHKGPILALSGGNDKFVITLRSMKDGSVDVGFNPRGKGTAIQGEGLKKGFSSDARAIVTDLKPIIAHLHESKIPVQYTTMDSGERHAAYSSMLKRGGYRLVGEAGQGNRKTYHWEPAEKPSRLGLRSHPPETAPAAPKPADLAVRPAGGEVRGSGPFGSDLIEKLFADKAGFEFVPLGDGRFYKTQGLHLTLGTQGKRNEIILTFLKKGSILGDGVILSMIRGVENPKEYAASVAGMVKALQAKGHPVTFGGEFNSDGLREVEKELRDEHGITVGKTKDHFGRGEFHWSGSETAPAERISADLPSQEPATAPKVEPASAVPEQKPVVPPADVTSKANTSAERVGERKNVPPTAKEQDAADHAAAVARLGTTEPFTQKSVERVAELFKDGKITAKEAADTLARMSGLTFEEIGSTRGVSKEAIDDAFARTFGKLELDRADLNKEIEDAAVANHARIVGKYGDGQVTTKEVSWTAEDKAGDKTAYGQQLAADHEEAYLTDLIEKLENNKLKPKERDVILAKLNGELARLDAKLTEFENAQRARRAGNAARKGPPAPAGTPAAKGREAEAKPPAKEPRAEAPAPTVAVQRTEGLTPEERKREAEARVDYASQPKDDTILFAPPTTPSPAGTPQAPGPQVGQHDIVQKIRKDFDVPSYRDTPPFGSQSDAAYWTKHMAQITGNMAAGSAQKGIHEAAHHLATKYDLPDDPAQLGPGIAAGFKQFDYVPNRPNAKVAIQEGFAEWMRRYATDDLKNLTKEQQEAAFFAEAFLAMKGQAKKLDGIREQFRDFAKQNPIQKAAGELSGTGSIPEPGDTLVQRVKDLSHRIDDTIWDDLAVWDRVEADRVKSGLAPTPADKNPRLVYSQLRMRNGDTAAEIEQKGYFTIQNGKRVFTGRGLDHVLEPWTKEDMAPLGSKATSILGRAKGFFEDPKRISKAEVFLIANHVLGEVSRGKRPVSQDQIDLFQEAMNEFMKDPEFMKRATEGAKRYTENMNDGLRALASPEIHRLEPDQADYHIKDKPDYVPLNRVKEQENWQAVGGRSKGEFMPNPVKARKGSGEQIVSPFVSLRMKALERASQINEQMRRNAAMELLLSGGLGKYALPGMEQQVADKAGNVYDTHEPWPTDGTKPSFWWAGPGGKMTNVRIGDRALYDLLTNQQVESSQLAKLARAYSGLTIGFAGKEFKPVEMVAKGVRGGATALNLGFQLKNVPRDIYTFLSNTQSQASVASLPKAYGQMYLYELAKLFQMVSGKDVADPVAKLFAEGRGGQMRQFAFEPSRPQSAYDRTQGGVIQKAKNLVDIGKQLLTVAGAGELGPRYQEFKNELKKRGWDEGKLRSELNAAEAQRKAGGNYVEPVPLGDLFAAYDAAAEVTVPFGRQGTLTRELNKITPFFGPGVAGLSKQIRNWKSNPKGAAAAMGVLMGLRLLYWSMYHDEDWYGELSDYDRYNNFVVPIPGLGLRRLPGPRGLEVGTGGTLTSILDASVGKNPRVGGLVSQSLQANLPPGIDRPAGSLAKGDYAGAAGEAAVAPLGPAGETGLDLIRNKDFTGRPIVPTRDENLPMRTKLTEKYLPYAVQQLSGGRGEPTLRGAGLEPVPQVKPKESVNVFYDTLKGMESERELAKKRGLKFEDEKKYDQMKKAEAKMTKLNAEARGEKRVGDKTVKIPVPDEQRKDEIRLELIRLAKEALK